MCRSYDTQGRDKTAYKILFETADEERALGRLTPDGKII
jgi:hypothetical protein